MSSTSDAERALASTAATAAAAAAASSSAPPIDPRKAALFSDLCDELLGRGDRIVLYDGICLVCNRFIQFVADRDPGRHVHFAPLQSELGAWIIQRKAIPAMDSMLLIAPGTPATQSKAGAQLDASSWFCRTDAALRILLRLHPLWLWSLLWLLLLVPAFLRDPFYKLFAALRYRLFGVVDPASGGASCRMLTKEERPRYLEYVVKDREKARKLREKEAAAADAAITPASASSILDAPASDAIRAQTDHELELAHGHTHTPLLQSASAPSASEQAPPMEEIASAKQAAGADELKQRKTKGAAEASS